jgi:hypothetical protein
LWIELSADCGFRFSSPLTLMCTSNGPTNFRTFHFHAYSWRLSALLQCDRPLDISWPSDVPNERDAGSRNTRWASTLTVPLLWWYHPLNKRRKNNSETSSDKITSFPLLPVCDCEMIGDLQSKTDNRRASLQIWVSAFQSCSQFCELSHPPSSEVNFECWFWNSLKRNWIELSAF